MPGYQEAAVKGYLKYHPPPYTAAQYNNSGMVEIFVLHRLPGVPLMLMPSPGPRISRFVCQWVNFYFF